MMTVYLISTHGAPKWDAKTDIPAGISVRFYQQFGTPMNNSVGLKLQSALANPQHVDAPAVLTGYPQIALWNGPGKQSPAINLTGDNTDFYTGIVHADTKKLILTVGSNSLITLTYALGKIREHADTIALNSEVVVHCLFCL